MPSIAFVDTEIDAKTNRILDIGSIKNDGSTLHSFSPASFLDFVNGAEFLCGHNILNHDLPTLKKSSPGWLSKPVIDTLYLSPLLFPSVPYHALIKDDKINPEGPNNPFNDALKARDLFYDEVNAFNKLDQRLKNIFYSLLWRTEEFAAFFKFINYNPNLDGNYEALIRNFTRGEICQNVELAKLISDYPIELAYSLSLIHSRNRYSITPRWILKSFPGVDQVMKALRNKPCLTGCVYCNEALDAHIGLKRFFGFEHFRSFGGQPLQEKAVKASIDGQSILAVFPTGGGKSITFQLPALIAGETSKALTVVISPLQSLMKDQVDNLANQDITEAVTINGLLDPIERANSFERVADGHASLLYISPESLRSPTITNLLLGRKIARFVIDEAHCFSSWGQDFRVDYLYIGEFIRELEEKKKLSERIPVSCFTATAKQKVIEDIRDYFRNKNGLNLELFTSKASRTNLTYKVLEKNGEEEKYSSLRDLIEEKNCPTIVYVSRTHRADTLSERLTNDRFKARPYHGKMDVKEKTANQEAFIKGEAQIMVATSAFGMGVDKKDIGMVIHYEISDSLENYIQEAGRAGRDDNMSADCFVLFNEEDLSKHFILLNQTKLSIKEIQQVWKAIKDITKFRMSVSNSALEIARKAGWDDNIIEIETRVTTAIAALEDAGYLKRGQNMPRIFADSILAKTAEDAIAKINESVRFDEKQKEKAIRIIKKLFSSKSRKQSSDEVGETRVDYISDHLGIVKEEVINIINLLRDERILADQKDLTAYIKKGENKNRSLSLLETSGQIEKCLLEFLSDVEVVLNVKEINEQLELQECKAANPNKIKTIINFWAIKNWIKRRHNDYAKNCMSLLCTEPKMELQDKMVKRHELATFIVNHLYTKIPLQSEHTTSDNEHLVEFSVHELKAEFERNASLFNTVVSREDVEDALFFLSRIEAIKVEGGFLVVYNRLRIERLEQNNKIQYKNENYQKLNQFYENRVQQIHIVGEYAKRMVNDYKNALQFVNDYFQLNFTSFLTKYFPGSRQNEIKRNITPTKFRQLFGTLSAMQLEIIKDNQSQYIVVAAGPGSGKTKVLVHKLASLALMEDVKTDQMLMVTFSRAAVTEFKRKLFDLVGNVANFIEIKTFHSYCFDLLGKIGTLEKSDNIIRETIEKIQSGEVELSRITKTVLVIDEAQDMDGDEFNLINTLIEHNEAMRIIAVGDDDQNIYAFRNADAKYMQSIVSQRQGKLYELTENYRSTRHLVDFTNAFANKIKKRLKLTSITSKRLEQGTIKIASYRTSNLTTPLVNDIINTSLSGSTCVLTRTNDEASKIAGLIMKHGLNARLIQSNDGFNLYNLFEVRYFLNQLQLEADSVVISDENWSNAKRQAETKFRNSNKLEILKHIISDFESTSRRNKFKSDLEVFIRESKLEDFYAENNETIFVSTIHKSKGREFENVFLMLDQVPATSDEELRPLYVAITRAKNLLSIHTNRDEFEGIECEGLTKSIDNTPYEPPSQLAMQLTLKDVWLDFCFSRQHLYTDLISGYPLTAKPDGCCDNNGEYVLKFSQRCKETITDFEQKGYELKQAVVNFIVYWKKDGTDVECKVIVPELSFQKRSI
ncbi:MAG: RecQ family ATP-dependent DNA helicase [Cyclobacteriaceae bacterium]